MKSFLWHIKDWWKSRRGAVAAPSAVMKTMKEASHSGAGRVQVTPSDAALKHMVEGAENYQKSFKGGERPKL